MARNSFVDVIDQQQTGGSGNAALGYTAQPDVGQSFTAGVTGLLTRVDVQLKIGGGSPTGNITCQLWSASGDDPLALLSTLDTVLDAATLTASYVTYTFTEAAATTYEVISGTKYVLVIHDSVTNGTNYAHMNIGANTNAYANGAEGHGTAGSSWTGYADFDCYFKTYCQRRLPASARTTASARTAVSVAQLVGHADTADDGNGNAADYIVMTLYTADATGSVTKLRVKCLGSGNMIVGIYTDATGTPTTLLNQSSSTAVVSGYNVIEFPPTVVTSGQTYWLAQIANAAVGARVAEASSRLFKAQAFGALPNPAGGGYANNDTLKEIMAGLAGRRVVT